MPAIAKTTDEEVVRRARKLVERHGAASLSMHAVADSVGVKAPSLYKRFPDRDALLEAVAEHALADLEVALTAANRGRTPAAALSAMAHAFRDFGNRHPRLYPLLFIDRASGGPSPATLSAVQPVLARLTELVGRDHALDAARLVVAFLHGFVSMEIAGAFRLGGDIDDAFAFALSRLLRSLT